MPQIAPTEHMLLRRAFQETGQVLFTKSLCQVLCNLPMMFGEVRKVSPINVEAHPQVHAQMRVVEVISSATKCRQARRYAARTTLRTP